MFIAELRMIALAAAVAGVVSSAHVGATSDVSAKFDGTYAGSAVPAPNMGGSGCTAFAIHEVSIIKGILRSGRDQAQPKTEGFITAEGYVSAFMTRAGHLRSPLDGRLENDVIVAGFIELDSNCHWIVKLARSR